MSKRVRKILIAICVVAIIISGGNLARIGYRYYKLEQETEEMAATYTHESTDTSTKTYKNKNLNRTIDFNSLLKINTDVAGWIYIPNTAIDEVLMHADDNDLYLHHNIYKKYLFAGQIFINAPNNPNLTDVNTIIYGHHMRNGSRFATLRKFTDGSYFKKHKYVYIYKTDGTINQYCIYTITKLNSSDRLYYDLDDYDYDKVVSTLTKNAFHTRDIEATGDVPLITLSTCVHATGTGRYVLGAYLVRTVDMKS